MKYNLSFYKKLCDFEKMLRESITCTYSSAEIHPERSPPPPLPPGSVPPSRTAQPPSRPNPSHRDSREHSRVRAPGSPPSAAARRDQRSSGTNFPCAAERSAASIPLPSPGRGGAGSAMLGPAVRLALSAGELGLPARLPALLWPAVLLGAAAAALIVLRGLRRGRAATGPRRLRRENGGARGQEVEDEDGPRRAAGALPARQPEEQKRTAQVPVNGEIITSVNIKEKKLVKPKKKRKAQCSDRKVPKDLLSVEKDKLQEEEGVWQTKISSREKRHLRKERLKQKEDPSRASLGSLVAEQAFDWDEKRALWPLTEDTSGGGKGALIAKAECGTTLKASGAIEEESVLSLAEEDVFSNVGTWDIAEVKSCPVTFGTLSDLSRELDNVKNKSSEASPSRCCWHTSSTFLPTDDAWQGQDDPSVIDQDSDWKAPLEEWGNWTGDEEHQTRDEKEKDLLKGEAGFHFCLSGLKSKMQQQKKKMEVKKAKGRAGLRLPQQSLQTRVEEGPRDFLSRKHSGDAVCPSFRNSLDVANNSPSNGVPGKKERRKRKKMKKET
ncbi:uncharacterized protein ACIB01_005403 [Guaruba guarouba]